MVYAAAYWAKSKNKEISNLGFDGTSECLKLLFRLEEVYL